MGTTRTCSSCGDSISGTLDHCPKDGTPFFPEEIMSRVGMVLRDHEIQGVIGEGGMGVVYRAQHVVIEKPVAIKVLHDRFARQKDMVEQFIIEAKAASRIRHPNIIDVTDFGTTPEGLVFLVMEYLDGESLEERLARVGRLPVFEAVNIVKQVARGLGAAHGLGVVHRDLKPANIFLCQREGRRRIVRRAASPSGAQFVIEPEDKYDFVKLLDFGVAKFMDLGPSVATRAGVLCGTPHYLSPEQAQEQPATERSDLYALGAVFYEMITGSVPFDGSSMFEILKGHVVGDVVPPSQRAPDAGINVQTDAVIGRCLEKDPQQRLASADELCNALCDCVEDRAFLRDAHRLPGIADSGLDLTLGTPAARRGAARAESAEGSLSQVESGFSEVEKGSEWADIDDADIDERPGRRSRSRDRRDTMRIPRQRSGSVAVVAVLLVLGAGGALWAVRGRLGWGTTSPDRGANGSGSGTSASVATSGTALSAKPDLPAAKPAAMAGQGAAEPKLPTTPRVEAAAGNAVAKAAANPTVAAVAAARAATVDKATDHGADKPGKVRPRSLIGGGIQARAGLPAPWPAETPPPVTAIPTAPPPPTPAPAADPSVDVEALLREAQQAWSRKYYAVAMDKAREVLKVAPGRHEAYQIIAVCSCAVGAAADAQEALSHLDLHKQKLVQTLCKSHGITLE
jgi:serine/threonine protein kinase